VGTVPTVFMVGEVETLLMRAIKMVPRTTWIADRAST